MYRYLLILPLLLLFTGCAQQAGTFTSNPPSISQAAPYSLEALDARYRQGL